MLQIFTDFRVYGSVATIGLGRVTDQHQPDWLLINPEPVWVAMYYDAQAQECRPFLAASYS